MNTTVGRNVVPSGQQHQSQLNCYRRHSPPKRLCTHRKNEQRHTLRKTIEYPWNLVCKLCKVRGKSCDSATTMPEGIESCARVFYREVTPECEFGFVFFFVIKIWHIVHKDCTAKLPYYIFIPCFTNKYCLYCWFFK